MDPTFDETQPDDGVSVIVGRPRLGALSALGVAVPAMMTLAAISIAMLTQFAYSDRWDVPYRWAGFVAAAVLVAGGAWLQSRSAGSAADVTRTESFALPRVWEIAAVAAVISVALFFRLYRFFDFPQGLWYDEANIGTDALYIIDTDHFTVWRDTNYGRATLYVYLLAGAFKTFGYTLFAFRIVPVASGLAAVVAFYFLARWMLGPLPALVATALLGASRWAVTFSRISWDAAMTPLFSIMAVLFLVKGLEQRNRFYFFIAGGSLAAGLYTYPAFRIMPFVALAYLLYVLIRERSLITSNWSGIVVYVVSFVLVVAPLAQFAATHRDQVSARTDQVNVFREIDDRGSYEPLRTNIEATFKMMNVRGDGNGRHNLPYEPMLDEITAALFVLGLAVSLWRARNWRFGALPLWLVLGLVPGAFTVSIENPSAIRDLVAIPPIYLMAGLAVAATQRALRPVQYGSAVFVAIAAALVSGSVALNYYDVFERQMRDVRVYDGFTPEYTRAGELLAEEAGSKSVYISRDFDGHPAVTVLGRGKKYFPYTASQDLIFPDNGRDVVLMLDPQMLGVVPTLQRLYPNIALDEYQDPFGRIPFARAEIPARDIAALHMLPMRVERGGQAVQGLPDAGSIDREWTEDELRDGPVTVTWSGYLWQLAIPGITQFEAEGQGRTELTVDGQRMTSDGLLATPELPLASGEHAITLTTRIERPGRVRFAAKLNGAELANVSSRLYGTSMGGRGFRVLWRRGSDFSAEPVGTGTLPFAVPVDGIGPARAIEYQGTIELTDGGLYEFALEGANSMQLFIDDQLVVDNGGAHPLQWIDGTADLGSGEHRVVVQYIPFDRPSWGLFMRPPGGDWRRMDGSEFAPPASSFTAESVVTMTPDTQWGTLGRAIPGLSSARAVAVLPGGDVVAASRDAIAILAPDGTVRRTFPATVSEIQDIATNEAGQIVVVDGTQRVLVTLDQDGNVLARIENMFPSIAGVTVRGDTAFVASPSGGGVYAVPLLGGEPTRLAFTLPEAPVRAAQPSDIAIADDGTYFVPDFERRTIVISRDGTSARAYRGVGGTGLQLPKLAPYGKLLLVSDPVNQRIVVYDRQARQRGVFSFPGTREGTRPVGIAVTPDGIVYAADIERGVFYRLQMSIPDALVLELLAQE